MRGGYETAIPQKITPRIRNIQQMDLYTKSCWSKSSLGRPTARRLLDYLSTASLGWVPPPVYPMIVIDAFNVAGSDSSGSLGMPLTSWTGEA